MKQFFCGDVVPGCTATFYAPDETALMGLVATHAQRDHGMDEIPDALVDQVRAKILETSST